MVEPLLGSARGGGTGTIDWREVSPVGAEVARKGFGPEIGEGKSSDCAHAVGIVHAEVNSNAVVTASRGLTMMAMALVIAKDQ